MKRFALFVVAVATLQLGCKPKVKPPSPVVPTPSATVQSFPTATATATPKPTVSPSPSPPVRHVAPKEQPKPDAKADVKAIVNTLPSVQRTRWNNAKIKPVFEIAVNKAVMLYMRTCTRYETVEKMRSDGVPAPILFCLHLRESDNDFTAHPHEGSSLLHRTRFVPKGRLPPPKEPPYKWEVSAEDAYYVADKLQGNWIDLVYAFDAMERFNGMGYRKRGILSPYIYSATQYYDAGKFVADGHFSATAVDKQLGCIAILKRMQQKGVLIAFDP